MEPKSRVNVMHEPKVQANNINGTQGPRCNYCGGLGYTNNIKGEKVECPECHGTGIANSEAPVKTPEQPKTFQEKGYAVLGMHGKDVGTVEGEVMLVRFFIGDKVVEEELPIPQFKTLDELVDEACRKRYEELKNE